MSVAVNRVLRKWLDHRLPEAQLSWLEAEIAKLADSRQRGLDILFGFVPRRLGKAELALSDDDLAAAARARSGWDPRGWTVDETARILALLEFAGAAPDRFAETFSQLCRTAEVSELVALYRGLPLYPSPEKLEWQAGEGLRTSMRTVFEAISHRNPYPRERFSEDRWNHMVLKALFIDSALAPIQGIDERSNPTLARILSDYAHERWAAGRPVTPELWRCLGPFAEGDLVEDLARLARSEDAEERRAAALALSMSPDDRAAELLHRIPVEAMMVKTGSVTWDSLSA
jgi:hypothetical protein